MRTNNQSGFAPLEAVLGLAIVAIVGGTGYYVYHATTKSNDTLNQANLASLSTAVEKSPAAQKQIIAAVKAYTPPAAPAGAAPDIIKVKEIVGNNASGTFGYTNEGGGAMFIAHKDQNKWTVVFEGQQAPGKALGTQYSLPKSWYSTSY